MWTDLDPKKCYFLNIDIIPNREILVDLLTNFGSELIIFAFHLPKKKDIPRRCRSFMNGASKLPSRLTLNYDLTSFFIEFAELRDRETLNRSIQQSSPCVKVCKEFDN